MSDDPEYQNVYQESTSNTTELQMDQESAFEIRQSRFVEQFEPVGDQLPRTIKDSKGKEARASLVASSSAKMHSVNSQDKLNQARHALVGNEMQQMLQQVQSFEKRFSHVCKIFTDRDKELKLRETKVIQRESWLRHRENSVLRRESNSKKREQEIIQREIEVQPSGRSSWTKLGPETECANRRSSLQSPARPRSLLKSKQRSMFLEESEDLEYQYASDLRRRYADAETLDETAQRDSPAGEERNERFRREGDGPASDEQGLEPHQTLPSGEQLAGFESSRTDQCKQTEGLLPVGKEESSEQAHANIGEAPIQTRGQGSTGEASIGTPLRRTPQPLLKRLSPFTPQTPPPPYRSPSTRSALSTPNSPGLGVLKRTRTTSTGLLGHVLRRWNSDDVSDDKKQRRIRKLELEAKGADAKLEKARREQRDQALERVRELQPG